MFIFFLLSYYTSLYEDTGKEDMLIGAFTFAGDKAAMNDTFYAEEEYILD